MIVTALQTRPIQLGDQLFPLLDQYVLKLEEKTVLVITSKIISICEGRMVKNDGTISKDELVQREAEWFIPADENQYGVHVSIKNNLMIASGGIDESNGNDYFVLWPQDPQKSAVLIWEYIRQKQNLKHLGVLITDSKLTPLRWGVTGVGIAFCGFKPLKDYRGTPDIFGRPLKVTQKNIVDGLAAAAVVVMGEGNERQPLATIQDAAFVEFTQAPPTPEELGSLSIDKKADIFANLLDSPLWKKGDA